MKADEAFINMFANLTVLHVVEFFFAMYFIIRISMDVIKFINKKHDEEQQKSADLAEALAGARSQNQLNQKLVDMHNEMDNKFNEVEKKFGAVMNQLRIFEDHQKQREKSRIRQGFNRIRCLSDQR